MSEAISKTEALTLNQMKKILEDIIEGMEERRDDFAQIKHYHRGYAGPRMTSLVNSESPAYAQKPLKVGERIAYWVMEYVPTIGRGDMSEARIRGATERLNKWAASHGYKIEDLPPTNFGERKDGTFVAFATWPPKIA